MTAESFQGRRWVSGSLAVGLLGLFATLLGYFLQPALALRSYLLAFCYWAGLSVGALVLLATFHAVHARWVVVLRRSLETMASSALLLPLLFLPLALGLGKLYLWASPPADLPEHARLLLEHKAPYLNVPSFLLRAGLYFALWISVAELLRAWSLRQDVEPPDEGLSLKQRRLAAGALPFLGVSLTFAAYDWLMSVDPFFFSTIFGVYYFAGSFLGAIAVLTLASGAMRPGLVSSEHLHNLGKLLFGFVCFWAYIAYSQFMLIWIANLPEEVPWYLRRISPGWRPLAIFLFLGHFALPFLALLSARLKRRPAYLGAVSLWLLLAHFVDLYWVLMPTLHKELPVPRWTDFTAFAGIGGVVVAFALYRLRGRSPVPVGDPYYSQSLRYTQP